MAKGKTKMKIEQMKQLVRKGIIEEKRLWLKGLLDAIRNCESCRNNPQVYMTTKSIPVCHEHWSELGNSDAEWSEDGRFGMQGCNFEIRF